VIFQKKVELEGSVLHVFLAVDIICFSLGLVVMTLSLLAYGRSGIIIFRHLAFLFVATVLLLLGRTIGVYEDATVEVVFGGYRRVLCAALTTPGNALLAYMICVVADEIVSASVSHLRRSAYFVFMVGAAALGAARELLPSIAFWILNNAGFAAILVCAVIVAVRRMDRVTNVKLLALLRSFAATAAVAVPVLIAQIILQSTRFSQPFPGDFPFIQILVFLVIAGFTLSHAASYLFEPEPLAVYHLPDGIANRYGISPREREIISMLVQGYTNRVIGEKLFISSTTVKNHIYHIYQKTGVTNKIQLINLINSPK
jgi:DNA-binding CsgD family transcriptional regulator